VRPADLEQRAHGPSGTGAAIGTRPQHRWQGQAAGARGVTPLGHLALVFGFARLPRPRTALENSTSRETALPSVSSCSFPQLRDRVTIRAIRRSRSCNNMSDRVGIPASTSRQGKRNIDATREFTSDPEMLDLECRRNFAIECSRMGMNTHGKLALDTPACFLVDGNCRKVLPVRCVISWRKRKVNGERSVCCAFYSRETRGTRANCVALQKSRIRHVNFPNRVNVRYRKYQSRNTARCTVYLISRIGR